MRSKTGRIQNSRVSEDNYENNKEEMKWALASRN